MTASATAANTRVPLGGDCRRTEDCVEGGVCVDNVCVLTPSGAPAVSQRGLVCLIGLLAMVAALGIHLRRRSGRTS